MVRVLPRCLSWLVAASLVAAQASPAFAQAAPATTPAPSPVPASPPPPPPESEPEAIAAATPLPTPEPTPSPAATPAPVYAAPSREARNRRMARYVGWISLGVGIEAAVFAAITSFMALHDKNGRDAHCDASKVCDATGLADNSQLGAILGWNAAAYAVAAIGIGTGLVLILSNPSDAKQTAVVVSPNGAGAGVSLRSAF
jgi:hypothetical protein